MHSILRLWQNIGKTTTTVSNLYSKNKKWTVSALDIDNEWQIIIANENEKMLTTILLSFKISRRKCNCSQECVAYCIISA